MTRNWGLASRTRRVYGSEPARLASIPFRVGSNSSSTICAGNGEKTASRPALSSASRYGPRTSLSVAGAIRTFGMEKTLVEEGGFAIYRFALAPRRQCETINRETASGLGHDIPE